MKKQQLVSLGLVVLLLSNSGFAVVASENITNTYIESKNPADETSDLLTNKNDDFSQKIAETGSELNNKTNIKQDSEENNVGDDTNNNEAEPSEKSNEDELGVDSSTAESEIVSEENKNGDATITEDSSQTKESTWESEDTVNLKGNNGEVTFDEKNIQRQSTIFWGNAPYEFDDTTGVLTVGGGIIDNKTQPWEQDVKASDIKKIVFTSEVVVDSTAESLFSELYNLVNIDGLNYINTSGVKNMASMFSGCNSLQSLDLSSFDTSNVMSMAGMFENCSSLQSLNLSSFNTSSVEQMEFMFFLCVNLNNVDLSSFNTSKVRTFSFMFSSCNSLQNLNLSSFDTSNAEQMLQMLPHNNVISSLSKLTLGDNFYFIGDAGLKAPNRIDEEVENTGKWIKQDGSSQAYTSKDFMLNYGTGDLTAGTYIGEVPNNLNLWGTAPYEFDDTTGIVTVGEGAIDNKTQPWKQDVEASKINKIVFSQHVKLIGDGSWLFSEDLALDQLSNLKEIEGLGNLDTSEITSMQRMFYGCSSLLGLDLSGFDTSKVTNMEGMFALCSSLKELDLSGFHTERVTNMIYMVNSCKSLNHLDLSSFDTSGITSMRDMFARTPLSKLVLGDKFRFQMNAGLQQPAEENDNYNTGKWIKEDRQSKAHTPESFMENYGTEDLSAGTYIGEIPEVKLTGKINFSRPEGVIGKELSATITIAHEGSNYKAENITVEINKFLDSDYIDQQTFKFDDELVIETRSTKDNSLISKTTKPFTDETVELEGLEVNNYYNVIISGIVWNNSKKTDDGNYHINIGYDYLGNSEKDNIAVQGFYFIQSGLFGLTNVPEKLVFKDTLFSPVMKELIVKRVEPSWGMEITDYRGTIGIEENIPADRSNWEIVATAKPFINEKGQSISQDVVGIIYTQNNQTTELSSDAETLIASHNVSGEIPQINHTTRLSWQGEEGFLAKVYNSKGIEPGDTLQAELTIELRSAP